MNLIIQMALTFIMCVCIFIYTKKAGLYKSDERGLEILAKSAQIVFACLFLIFAIFMLYVAGVDIFDLPLDEMVFSLDVVRNGFLFVVSLCSFVNVFAILYYEKKL